MNLSAPHCDLCGSAALVKLFVPARSPGPVVRCRNCGLVFIHPRENVTAIISDGAVLHNASEHIRTSSNEDDIQSSWELPIIQQKEREWIASRVNYLRVLDRIARYLQPGRVLDFGCGCGLFLLTACERGWQPFGLEPLPAHAVYTRSRTGAIVINDVLRDDTFSPDFFDLITAFQVFEHLPDPVKEMSRLANILKPGGIMVVEVPNIENWLSKIMRSHSRHFVPDHLYFFSKATIARMMTNAGMEVVSIVYPARNMTLGHLLFWLSRYWVRFRITAERSQQSPILRKQITINLGDIIEVMARKPIFVS